MTLLQGKVKPGEYELDGGYIAKDTRPVGRGWYITDKAGTIVAHAQTLLKARKWACTEYSKIRTVYRVPVVSSYVLDKMKSMRERGFPDKVIADAMKIPVSTVVSELRNTPRPGSTPQPPVVEPEPVLEPPKIISRQSLPPRIETIVKQVATRRGLIVHEMLSRRQMPRYAHARQECYTLLHDELKISMNQIGVYFQRDHTSVMHGILAHKKRTQHAGETAQNGA